MPEKERLVIGRRNFMKAAAVLPAAGAYTYAALQARPLQAAIIGTGNQGRVLLENADPSVIKFNAMCDFRPDHRLLGRRQSFNTATTPRCVSMMMSIKCSPMEGSKRSSSPPRCIPMAR
ncbi:twin-arginine translocation signal domain-containing protein [bacterium]|nr:twin-arginine translocation signal domain-containing protein [bacterium]